MIDVSAPWDKYRSTIRDFDSILEHGKAVSASLVGITPAEHYLSYGEQVFVKLLGHCVTLRNLAPDPTRRTPTELWDLASLSAVARCTIEAHDAFFYIALSRIEPSERAFRILLWELHDKTRRKKMLESIGSKDPRMDEIRTQVSRLYRDVTEDTYFQSLSNEVRKKISEGDPPPYYLSQRQRCDACGINFDFYNTATMQLSQYVHTLPFAIHQLFKFKAGSPDALSLMELPFQYTLPFMARVIYEMRNLYPNVTPEPPSRVAQKMEISMALAAKGIKSTD